MKELSIEEKAKLYDEAIKVAADIKAGAATYITDGTPVIDAIFPELKESDDERIRQLLIRFVKYDMPDNYSDDFSKEECLAWLEKQSEQKPTDKIESKFKVGNWYQCTKDFFGKGVTFDKNTAYYCAKDGCLQNEYGCHIAIVKELCDNFKLWTIKDAKAGDVLVCEDFGYTSLMLFKSFSNSRISLHCWYNSQTNNFHINTDVALRKDANIYPATKEQRDTLEKAMADAGYTFDFEKKELKKIEQKLAEWGEDDQSNFCELRSFIVETYRAEDASKLITWLESLKDRVQPQPKQEWSEEDEQTFIKSVEALEDFGKFELADWLKEHKNQFLKPHNTWKPSDEQMNTLEYYMHTLVCNEHKEILFGLYSCLKKLREE